MTSSPIERVLRKLYGRPCWRATQGYASFLTLEFGKPHLEVHEPTVATGCVSAKVRKNLARRRVFIHGEWHLWIYRCDWEVFSGAKRVGDSRTSARISRAAKFLDGQKLISLSISPRKVQCVFKFDLGGTLKTRPLDEDGEQWKLFDPLHKVLTVRADGCYAYHRSDSSNSAVVWKKIQGGNRA